MKATIATVMNIILTTLLLTSILLIEVTTSTSENEVASNSEYDPWFDYDENGEINILDAIKFAGVFGTSGNPAKPVIINMCNWSYGGFDFWILPGEQGNLSITTAGCKQITLGFKILALGVPPYGNISVATGFILGNYTLRHVYVDRFNVTAGWAGPELPSLAEYPVVRTYEVRGQMLTIAYYNPNLEDYRLMIEYYMTT